MLIEASGDVGSFSEAQRDEIAAKVATELGVAAGAVRVAVRAASVLIAITIAFGSEDKAPTPAKRTHVRTSATHNQSSITFG